MNFGGLLLGFVAFLIIGLCHPLVAKLEYYKGKKSWPFLFIPGLFFLIVSFFAQDIFSILFGIIAFALFWSTVEMFKQHERAIKGQVKRNPDRNYSK